MLVSEVRREALADGRFELSANVRLEDGSSFGPWIRVPGVFGGPAADDASPFLVALLPLCMRRREPLEVRAYVSARLLGAVHRLQEILWSFWPDLLDPVPVHATGRAVPPGPIATASFFTRGMDSWYTVLTADEERGSRPPLSHLVYVPSADIWDADRAQEDLRRIAAAADRAGLPLLAAETNLRELAEPILGWDEYHGAFLAACGLTLGPSHLLIPSTGSDGELVPIGSHPLLDPLWSTERTSIINHGDAIRLVKARVVAGSPAALATLRVCWMEAENCGRCSKCLYAMSVLDVVGALRDCETFPDTLDPRALASVTAGGLGRQQWPIVASRFSRDADGRARRLATELALLRRRANELAAECESLERLLEDREAVDRAIPGMHAKLRTALKKGRKAADRISGFPAPLR